MLNGIVTTKEINAIEGVNNTLEIARKVLKSCDSVYGNKVLSAAVELYTAKRNKRERCDILKVIGDSDICALCVRDAKGRDAVVFPLFKTNTELSAALGDTYIYQVMPLIFNQLIDINYHSKTLKSLGYEDVNI